MSAIETSDWWQVFSALTSRGLNYCLMRPTTGLLATNGDVDVLVARSAAAAMRQTLVELGFISVQHPKYTPHKEVFERWTGVQLLTLDLHFEVVVHGLVYLDADGVVDRSSIVGAIREPAPPDLAAILLVHDLVGKGIAQPKYHDVLREAWPVLPQSQAALELATSGLWELIPQTPAALETLLLDSHAAAALGGRLRRRLMRKPANAAANLAMRWHRRTGRPRRGLSLALLGPDGSGKTTTMQALLTLIRDELGWPVTQIYMGPWGHDRFDFTQRWRFDPPLQWRELRQRRATRLAAGERPVGPFEPFALEWRRRRHALDAVDAERRLSVRELSRLWMAFEWLRGHARYAGFIIALATEMVARHAAVLRHKRRGHIVLCDRYIYDLLAGRMHGFTDRYQWLRSVFVRLYPKADITVLLHNSAETLMQRKAQMDEATLRAMLGMYERLAVEFDFVIVETKVAPAQVARDLLMREFDRMTAIRRGVPRTIRS